MSAPTSRTPLYMELCAWAARLHPRDIGVRGEIFVSVTKSSVIITVQDDRAQEVITYKVTLCEIPPEGPVSTQHKE